MEVAKVSDMQKLALNHPISTEEIEKVVFQLDPNKSPKPDGFPISFYQEN